MEITHIIAKGDADLNKVDISYISDLHLDFHVSFTKNQIKFEQCTREFIQKLIQSDISNKEVLIVAGDVSHLNTQSYWCIDEFSKHYKQVLLCYGNHDFYLVSKSQERKYKNNSLNRINELTEMLRLLDNVHVFTDDNYVFEYDNVKFGGLTMWYPLETPEQQMFFYNISNDSKLIKGFNISESHDENQSAYKKIVEEDVDVMISHVPVISIDSHFKYNSTACYLTPVKDIHAKHWIMAHSHEQKVYEKPYCTFYMNALGYPNEGLNLSISSFHIEKGEEKYPNGRV